MLYIRVSGVKITFRSFSILPFCSSLQFVRDGIRLFVWFNLSHDLILLTSLLEFGLHRLGPAQIRSFSHRRRSERGYFRKLVNFPHARNLSKSRLLAWLILGRNVKELFHLRTNSTKSARQFWTHLDRCWRNSSSLVNNILKYRTAWGEPNPRLRKFLIARSCWTFRLSGDCDFQTVF